MKTLEMGDYYIYKTAWYLSWDINQKFYTGPWLDFEVQEHISLP